VIARLTRTRFLLREVDERRGDRDLELMSVSMTRGVVPRSDLTNDEPRADDLSNYKVCRVGDIVVNRMSAYQGALGMAGQNGIVSPDYIVFRPGDGVVPRWLHHVMRSAWFVSEMATRIRGIGSIGTGNVRTPRVSAEEIGEIRVVVPDRVSQQHIADYLDTETARIDALIAKKQRMIELLGKREARRIDDVLSFGGSVPLVRLGYLARLQTGLTLDSSRSSADVGSVTLPYLRVANVQAGSLDLAELKDVTVPETLADRCRLQMGDVLMTEGGDLDKLGRGTVWSGEVDPCLHQNHVFAVRCDTSRLLPEFLAYISRTSGARMYFESTGTRSTNLASTNSAKVLSFRLPLPSIQQQAMCVEAVDRSTEVMGRARDCLRQQIGLLREHRQALITAAVTGELEVPGVAA
jgi:type I restriction enzyme S subunit